ncbi:MAG: hypothetical protein MZW92_11965 [Comamonadaceae bacterium]|nr:hypothetical protein [Comamonadaceae bacterium]
MAGDGHRARYAVFGGGHSIGGAANPHAGQRHGRPPRGAGGRTGLPRDCGRRSVERGGLRPGRQPPHAARCVRAPLPRRQRVPGPGAGSGPRAAQPRRRRGPSVSHEPTATAGNEFDGILTWVPVTVLAGRLLAAGRLP